MFNTGAGVRIVLLRMAIIIIIIINNIININIINMIIILFNPWAGVLIVLIGDNLEHQSFYHSLELEQAFNMLTLIIVHASSCP